MIALLHFLRWIRWRQCPLGVGVGLWAGGLVFALEVSASPTANLEDWSAGAVWYQIFPERFRNGDPDNDLAPTHHPERQKIQNLESFWKPTSWTSDWYALSEYEKSLGLDFYGCVSLRRYGGDLQGIIDRLDYLQDLGITAIYMNPVFQAESSHKYDWARLHHVDPWFGPDPLGDLTLMDSETLDPSTWQWTSADKLLLKLIKECHRRGIRVTLDGVFNHSGRMFPAFQALRKEGPKSAFAGWFSGVNFNKRSGYPGDNFDYRGWWGFKSLPEFSEFSGRLHPDLESYILASTRRWMDPDSDGNPSDGIDGWRLDVADEVSPVFWNFWHAEIRNWNPDIRTFAETWKESAWLIREGGFDAAMNYYGFAMPVKAFVVDDAMVSGDFLKLMHARLQQLPSNSRLRMMNFLDTHDTDRVVSIIANRKRKTNQGYNANNRVAKKEHLYLPENLASDDEPLLSLAVFLQMVWPGSPMIYYGTEAGMWGGGDPDNRMPMIWDDLKFEDQSSDPLRRPRKPDPVAFSKKRFDFYRNILAFRAKHPALTIGDLEMAGNQSADNLFAFTRNTVDQRLFILVNRDPKQRTFRLTSEWAEIPSAAWEPLYVTTGELRDIRLVQLGNRNGIQIPGRSGAVLKIPVR